MSNVSSKLGNAAFLMLLTRLMVNGLGIISSLILVRLLSPADFGVAAIAMSIYAFISLFGEFGFNTALIHKNELEKQDYDTAFTVNFLFGVLACLAMWLCSNAFTSFFEEPRLSAVFNVLGLLFLINGTKNIKTVDFQIDMDFKQEMKLQVLPKLLSFFFTIGLAIYFNSYWALVIGSLFASLLNVLFSYLMLPFVPSFSLVGCRALFNYSKWLMLNNFFYYLNNKSIDLIVGKYISTSAAGIYSISKEMATLPSAEIAAPINKASFPAYSKNKHDFKKLCELFYETTSMVTVIALPASLGLMVTADYFVPVVLGEKWLDAIPVIQILSVFAFITSISSNNGYIFLATGKPHVTTIMSGIRIASFFIFLFGFNLTSKTEEPAIALVLSAILSFVIAYTMLKLEIGISIGKVWQANWRAVMASILMTVIVLTFKLYTFHSVHLLSFLALVGIGIVSYVCFIFLFWLLSNKPDSIERKVLAKITQIMQRKANGKI